MTDPVAFLRAHPPFDALGPASLELVERTLEVEYRPAGELLLRRGGEPAEHLFVVRKGSVRLERDGQAVQTLEEGECFAFPSLIARAAPVSDAFAAEDVLLYRLPRAAFDELMRQPEFAHFFLADLAARLRQAVSRESAPLAGDLGAPVGEIASRRLLWIGRDATIGRAAREMQAAGASSILVEGEPPGILTDRDLRRLLAAGQGADAPVAAAMTSPVATLAPVASLFEALLFMLERRVHHVPVESDGRIVGLITDTDLVRLQLKSPLYLLRELEQLADDDRAALGGYAGDLASMVETLLWGGMEAGRIGRVVSRLNDALVARLLRIAEARLGSAPAPYAWLVLGSEGRMEQTLLTDQDNALAHGEGGGAERDYFERLAARVVAGLTAAGFPPCRGGFMATRWNLPLSGWRSQFERWIETPEPRALLEASNFFDFRRVHGELDVSSLDERLQRAGSDGRFLAHLAHAALGFRPPLGLFRQIRRADGGVDLKAGGLLPVVGLARLHALAAGSTARPTLERLEAAVAGGELSAEGGATLAEAFRFLARLRLRGQLEALRRGEPARGTTPLSALSPLEQRHLKEVFLAVREIQDAAGLRYGTGRLA